MSNTASAKDVIADALGETAYDADVEAGKVLASLADAGYSIVPSTPARCVDDPRGSEHRWVRTAPGFPGRSGWRCVDCHLRRPFGHRADPICDLGFRCDHPLGSPCRPYSTSVEDL